LCQPAFLPLCLLLLFAALFGFPGISNAAGVGVPQDEGLPVEAQEIGFDPACVMGFLQEISAAGMENHSMIIIRNDQIVFETNAYPYAAEMPHEMFSVTKSVVSTTVGFAIAEGKLSLDTKIIDLFAEYKHGDAPG
jgi:hypothetical protein